jgi:hypothetical protein
MTQPLGNCPGCGTDEPFEKVHPGDCPDVDGACPEWACVECGAGVFMGTVIAGPMVGDTVAGDTVIAVPVAAGAPVGPSVRAA